MRANDFSKLLYVAKMGDPLFLALYFSRDLWPSNLTTKRESFKTPIHLQWIFSTFPCTHISTTSIKKIIVFFRHSRLTIPAHYAKKQTIEYRGIIYTYTIQFLIDQKISPRHYTANLGTGFRRVMVKKRKKKKKEKENHSGNLSHSSNHRLHNTIVLSELFDIDV